MDDWKPKPRTDLDVSRLDLTEDEGFVFSQIDGSTSVTDLHQVTGISPDQLSRILQRLLQLRALLPLTTPESDQYSLPQRADQHSSKQGNQTEEPVSTSVADIMPIIEKGNYRKLFELKFHPLDNDEREKLARTVTGADLSALCYDPDYRVILALFENSRFGLQHARLIAANHRNPAGLNALGSHDNFIRDEAVQRFLMRNVQLSNYLVNKMTIRKSLVQLYTMLVGGDSAERVKRLFHKTFRVRFQRASGDECLALILKTEGRCLTILTGIPLNAKTVALLCGRTINSLLLIQNLARWATTPPKLLEHLSRQPMVKRNSHLQTLIFRHPNCPSSVKTRER